MSGARINNYTPSTTTIDSVIGSVDYGVTGMLAVSLTNYTSTIIPSVAAGSIAEVASDVFQFSTEEAISTVTVTSTSACDYYIKLVPSSSQCTAVFSTTAPTWRTDYQGYYHNSTSVERVIGETYFTGANYIDKQLYYGRGSMKLQYCNGIDVTAASLIFGGAWFPSTIVVNMDGYVKSVLGVVLTGTFYDYTHITSISVQSTTVTIVLNSTVASGSTGIFRGSIFVTGVNY